MQAFSELARRRTNKTKGQNLRGQTYGKNIATLKSLPF